MLPIVTTEILTALETDVQQALEDWKREMVHHVKEDNPEVNSLLLNLAQSSADAKSVILAGYLVYRALELAEEAEHD